MGEDSLNIFSQVQNGHQETLLGIGPLVCKYRKCNSRRINLVRYKLVFADSGTLSSGNCILHGTGYSRAEYWALVNTHNAIQYALGLLHNYVVV